MTIENPVSLIVRCDTCQRRKRFPVTPADDHMFGFSWTVHPDAVRSFLWQKTGNKHTCPRCQKGTPCPTE